MKNTILILCLFCLNYTGIAQDTNNLTCKNWQDDLSYILNTLPNRHANLFHSISEHTFYTEAEKLNDSLCYLSDKHKIVALSEFIARINDAHSWLDFRSLNNWEFNSLPIKIKVFYDGIYIINTTPNYSGLIGKEIISINDIPIDSISSLVRQIGYRENDFTEMFSIGRFLPIVEVLSYYKIIDSYDNVPVILKDSIGKISNVVLKPEAYNNLSFPDFPLSVRSKLPLYRQRKDEIYWSNTDFQNGIFYLQINSMSEDEHHSFKELSGLIAKGVDNVNTEKIVIDLRWNFGGNAALTYPLIFPLMKFERDTPGGNIFLITGRRTLSASVVFTNEVLKYTKTIVVGEPTGARPNLYGENSYNLTLPKSKIEVSYSSAYFQSAGPFEKGNFIKPDYFIPIHSFEYFSMIDPVYQFIFRYQDSKELNIGRMEQAYADGDYDTAILVYREFKEKLINKYVDTERPIRKLADNIAENNIEAAKIFYELNFEEYPNRVLSYINLAIAYEDIGNNRKANELYKIVLDKLPHDNYTNDYLKHYIEDFVLHKLEKSKETKKNKK